MPSEPADYVVRQVLKCIQEGILCRMALWFRAVIDTLPVPSLQYTLQSTRLPWSWNTAILGLRLNCKGSKRVGPDGVHLPKYFKSSETSEPSSVRWSGSSDQRAIASTASERGQWFLG